jgi:hypothetical protein
VNFLIAFGCLAIALLASCSSGAGSEPSSSPTAATEGSATVAPTRALAPSPVSTAVGDFDALIEVFEVATGNRTTLYAGAGATTAWFSADGESVNAGIGDPSAGTRVVQFGLDGSPLYESSTAIQLRIDSSGTARAYGTLNAAGDAIETTLEVRDEVVPLAAASTTLPLSFSPAGDRVLSFAATSGTGTLTFDYAVHEVASGDLLATFSSQAVPEDQGANPPRWSPSGRYVAILGTAGLIAHDVEGGAAIAVGANGWTEWSPAEDALLIAAGPNEFRIVRVPDLDTTSLDIETGGATVSFDASGAVVVVSDRSRRSTVVFDAATGERIEAWGGVAERVRTIGFEPVIRTDAGLAAVLEEGLGCDGFVVHHPALTLRGQCVDGRNPRWSPDGSTIAFVRRDQLLTLEVATEIERVLITGLPAEAGGTLARWNRAGTHLLLKWPWGGPGWSETVP